MLAVGIGGWELTFAFVTTISSSSLCLCSSLRCHTPFLLCPTVTFPHPNQGPGRAERRLLRES